MAARFVTIVVLAVMLIGVGACASPGTPTPVPTVPVTPDPAQLVGLWRGEGDDTFVQLSADGTLVVGESVTMADPVAHGTYSVEVDLFKTSDNICEEEGVYRFIAFETEADGTVWMELRPVSDACQMGSRREVYARKWRRESQ